MSKIVYDRATVTAAAALWEVFLENRLSGSDVDPGCSAHLDQHGACTSRDLMVDLAPIAEEAWIALTQDEQDGLEWDWGFIPMVLEAVNWSDLPKPGDDLGGRHINLWLPTAAEVLNTVRRLTAAADLN